MVTAFPWKKGVMKDLIAMTKVMKLAVNKLDLKKIPTGRQMFLKIQRGGTIRD